MNREEQIRRGIADKLQSLGFQARRTGYHFLKEAIALVAAYIQNDDLQFQFENDIYPAVAEKYNAKPRNVERNIRSTIKEAWEQNPVTLMDYGFKTGKKPTNTEFVTLLAEKIR